MSPHAALALRKGDRTMVEGRLAEVVEVFAKGHPAAGSVRLVFPRHPWLSMIVAASTLFVVGFGCAVRKPEPTVWLLTGTGGRS